MNRKDLNKLKKDELIDLVLKQAEALKKSGKNVIVITGEFEDKETAKVYTFKDGWAKTRNSKGKVVDSDEILNDASEMRRLIDMGYGGLEVVRVLEVDDNDDGDAPE